MKSKTEKMRSIGLSAIFILLSFSAFSQVTENFNHNDISVSEGNCWEFSNVDVEKPNASVAINNGANRPLASADINGFGSATLSSPYMEFDGTGTIDFEHKMLNETGGYINLTVIIQDPSGATAATLLSHTYRLFYSSVNGDPTNNISESINISYTGWGKVIFSWTYLDATTSGFLDDISISGTYAADDNNESSGYCPAEMMVYDTICSGDQTVSFEALYNDASHTYSWSFSESAPGTIDATISSNDDEITVDFDTISGNFTLIAQESTTGHLTVYNLVINPLPNLTFEIDSICEEEPWEIELSLIGTAPWEITYSYTGSGNITEVTSDPDHIISLPGTADTFNWVQIQDGTGCINTKDFMPVVNIPYFPKPGPTGPIYH